SSPSSFFLERRQRLEARALELGNPSFGDLVDRGWVDEVQLLAAPASPRNEVRLLEQRQMLGDRLARHGEARHPSPQNAVFQGPGADARARADELKCGPSEQRRQVYLRLSLEKGAI